MTRLAISLLTLFPLLFQVLSQESQPQCSATPNNNPATCAALLANTTQDCDCYIFCNGEMSHCAAFDTEVDFSCVGSTVAGCTKDMLSADATETPTVEQQEEECAVTISADDATCADLLDATSTGGAPCDCYNFCNGKLNGCVPFGERQTFSCSGTTVAGCTAAQRKTTVDTTSGGSSNGQGTKVTLLFLLLAGIFVG